MENRSADPSLRDSSPSEAQTKASPELLESFQNGDRRSFHRLRELYGESLRRWVSCRAPHSVCGHAGSDELLDQVLSAVSSGEKLRHEGDLLERLRQELLELVQPETLRPAGAGRADSQGGVPAPPQGASAADPGGAHGERDFDRGDLRRYDAALEKLSAEERQAIVMRIEMGYTDDRVAEALAIPSAEAARGMTCRALLRLAMEMAHEA